MASVSKTHIVFDLDDTLTNSYGHNQELFVLTFKPYLNSLTSNFEKYLRNLHFHSRGESMLSQFATAVSSLKLPIDPAILVTENETLHTQKAHEIKIFSNVIQTLELLKKSGKRLYICTNRQTQSSHKILNVNQIDTFFDQIISCTDAGYEKPDPFCLTTLINQTNIPNKNFLYVGDSPTDQLFAQNAHVESLIIKPDNFASLLTSFTR